MENHDLLLALERLKAVLIAASRQAEGFEQTAEYVLLRKELLASRLKDRLPRFVTTCRALGEFWHFIQPKFPTYKERRDYIAALLEPLLAELERQPAPSDAGAAQALVRMSSAYVEEQWRKALDRRTSDPDGAITAARTLLEAVCKHILDAAGVSYKPKDDLPDLYGSVAKTLNLSPAHHTEEIFKQILGGCFSVVQGLGALRNKISDAHGQGSKPVRPAPRHAELAVNLAGAVAAFLWATHEQRVSSAR
jgi:hypothetical protein